MKLGFVSAILADLDLEQVATFASSAGFKSVELMCWPPGKAERRYAGVTHIDVTTLFADTAKRTLGLLHEKGLTISGLGYYPNVLSADADEARTCTEHVKQVIVAAKRLGVGVVNTFIGRNPKQSVDENWPNVVKTWTGLVQMAADNGVRIAIENCPMLFTADEWPGGKNIASSPAIWRRLFSDIPGENLGLNFDPSHLVWQRIDMERAIHEFGSRIFHAHAKDARVDQDKLGDVGILAHPLQYHSPKLPGLGDVDWGAFFAALGDIRYEGDLAIEVEDRAFEDTLESRKRALIQSKRFLESYMS